MSEAKITHFIFMRFNAVGVRGESDKTQKTREFYSITEYLLIDDVNSLTSSECRSTETASRHIMIVLKLSSQVPFVCGNFLFSMQKAIGERVCAEDVRHHEL